jgi:hypothetical protein
MSTVVRVPDDVYAAARHIAALKGEQASDVIARAWSLYFEQFRDQIADEIEEAAHRLRAGDGLESESLSAKPPQPAKPRPRSRRARAAA